MHDMTSKLKNAVPLFITVRKWVGSLLTSGLTSNFTQVKVKGRHVSQSELYIFESRRFLRIYFFLCIKLRERLIKIQCTRINNSYLKFRHVPELSHSVH